MLSSTLPMPADVRWRRLVGIAIFLGMLFVFRKLAPVFICFVILERSLGFCADQASARLKIQRKGAILGVLGLLTAIAGATAFWAVRRTLPLVKQLREEGPAWLASLLDQPLVAQVRHMTGTEGEHLT